MGSCTPLEDGLAARPLASLGTRGVALSWLPWCRKTTAVWSELPLGQRTELWRQPRELRLRLDGEEAAGCCPCAEAGSYSVLGRVLFQRFSHV